MKNMIREFILLVFIVFLGTTWYSYIHRHDVTIVSGITETPTPTFISEFVIPVETSTDIAPVSNHIRSTSESGSIGVHDPGRSDHRTP